MNKELEEKYNKICATVYMYFGYRTMHSSSIDLTNIDVSKKSHLMVLAIAKATSGLLNKKIRVNLTRKDLAQLNRFITDQDCLYSKLPKKDKPYALDITTIVADAKEVARKLELDENCLDDIYDEFYGVSI